MYPSHLTGTPPQPRTVFIWTAGISFLGCALLGLSDKTFAPFFVQPTFAFIGFLFFLFFFKNGQHERFTFLLSYATCTLVAGASEAYSLYNFGYSELTAVDAIFFYEISADGFRGIPLEKLHTVTHLPIAIQSWRGLYEIAHQIGFNKGPWLGTILNSFVVGIASGLTVRIGHMIFGEDHRRLRLVGLLCILCGAFWLYGGIFLRGCFALLINVVILYAAIKFLTQPRLRNFLLMLMLFGICAFFMNYVRRNYYPLFFAFLGFAYIAWLLGKRQSIAFIFSMVAISLVALIAIGPLLNFAHKAGLITMDYNERYTFGLDRAGSLAYSMILGQPMPIRLVLGFGYFHVFPIPLWSGFTFMEDAYHWIKSCQGIFMVIITPLGFYGIYEALKNVFKGGPQAPPTIFLALFYTFTLLAVIATSFETRHAGQFMSAFFLLAAIPDWNDPQVRNQIKWLGICWYGLILLVHFAHVLIR